MTDTPIYLTPDKPTAKLPAPVTAPQKKTSDVLARGLALLALLVAGGSGFLAFGLIDASHAMPEWKLPLNAVQQKQQDLADAVKALQISADVASSTPAEPTASTAQPDAKTAEQLHAALTELASMRQELANLKEGIGGAKEVQLQITQLKNDLSVANTAIASMHGNVQKMTATAHEAAAAEETTRTQVIAYLQLRNAAATATPFINELKALGDAAKDIPAIASAIAKLDNAAHAGVATLPMLQSRFAVMSGPAEQALDEAAAKTWWDRMAASMQDVVKVRKINRDDNGSAPARAIHDAAAALQRGDIPGAIGKVETMPPAAQKHLQEWLMDAKARVALDVALAQIGLALGQATPHATEPAAP